MTDTIIHAIIPGLDVRLLAGITTDLVAEACRRHQTAPTASAALGRTLTGALLLGMTHKDLEKTTLQFQCDGPIGGIVAQADAHGNVRGYVKEPSADVPETAAGKLDVAGVVGNGTLVVAREAGFEIGLNKDPYYGTVEIVSGEIAEDITCYLEKSEQIPSAISLGVYVNMTSRMVLAAGGFIIQMMPGSTDDLANDLARRVSKAPHATDMIRAGASPLDLLHTVLGDYSIEVIETREARFRCTCSRERVHSMLGSLELSELEIMIADAKGEEVICHVCNEHYQISVDELREILFASTSDDGGPTN